MTGRHRRQPPLIVGGWLVQLAAVAAAIVLIAGALLTACAASGTGCGGTGTARCTVEGHAGGTAIGRAFMDGDGR